MADWKNEDPFAGGGSDDPFPGEVPPPPVVAEPKPSFLRRAAGAVGGAIAELPQIVYEGAAGTANAFARQTNNALALPDYIAGTVMSGSPQQGLEFANERIQQNANWNPVPPTLGQGSWTGRGIGYGVNKLVELGLISQGSAKDVGDLLAIVGAPGMVRGLRAVPSAAGKVFPNTARAIQQRFPSAPVRAGQLVAATEQTLSPELPQGARETANIAAERTNLTGAQQRLGVQRLPESADPNIRRQQLATNRMGQNVEVKASEFNLADQAAEQAAKGLNAGLKVEEVNPAVLDFVGKKIEAHNAAQTAAEQATTAGAKTAAQAGVETAARAALDDVESVIPKTGRLDPLPMGQRLLQRVRGEDGESGIRAVQKVFNTEYEKFDAQGAVASSAELADAVKASADVSTETGRVLRGFVDESKKIEQRLGGESPDTLTLAEEAAGKTAGEFSFPEDLTLKQFRGLKGEFATAAELARKSNNRPAAMELDRLAEMARKGENAAIESLGPEAVAQYDLVRSAYKNVFVEAFRRGYGGKMTGFGTQSGGGKVPPASVFPQLMSRQNAHDFTLALGAEEAAKSGKLLTGLAEPDLLALGRKGAQETVRPYVESTVATLYQNAGGGKKGVAAVEKYLNANANTIDAYGLDVSGLRTAATKYNEAMSRLTGAKTSVAKGVVEGVIPTTDPTKLGKYVFDSANPKAAYKNLMAVSPDPMWRSSVRTMLVDDLKTRIDSGVDVFANAKIRSGMESAFPNPKDLRVLQDYHTIMKRLNDSPAHGAGKELSPHALELVEKAAELPAVGFGPWYVAKRAVVTALKLKTAAADAAALSWVDDAFINPAKARDIKLALKGHEAAAERIRQGVKEEGMSMAKLAGAVVPKAAPGVVGSAISNAGQKKETE